MNTHKHARLTFARRFEMVKQMTLEGLDAVRAAAAHGVTAPTARKWLGRYLAGGEAALADASSKPTRSPRAIDSGKALLILELRKRRMLQSRIARSVGVSASTVSRVLTRAGMSKLSDLEPAEPIVRYEHEAPGDLLHIDTKKLGRIVRPSHRVTGNRRDSVDGAGWETLFVAIDDHARLAFTAMHPDEKQVQAVLFLRNAVNYYARLGITVRRLLTDNGPAFRSREFKATCTELGIRHSFTRPYRPQTNGKAERFIKTLQQRPLLNVKFQIAEVPAVQPGLAQLIRVQAIGGYSFPHGYALAIDARQQVVGEFSSKCFTPDKGKAEADALFFTEGNELKIEWQRRSLFLAPENTKGAAELPQV